MVNVTKSRSLVGLRGGRPAPLPNTSLLMDKKKNVDPDRPPKRGRTEVNALQRLSNPSNPSPTEPTFPKFLVMQSGDPQKPLRKVSPFAVARELSKILGPRYNVKKLPTGDLLVEVHAKFQSDALLSMKELATHKIHVTAHRTLNTRLGVVSDEDLIDVSEDEILEGFKEEQTNVIAVRRIKIRRKDEEIATKHLVLTFNSTTLPDNVHLGYLNLRVRPYVPNPRRCFRCQRYGHTQQSCRGKPTCALCASTEHGNDACDEEDLKCVNCSGEHPAYSRKCPRFRQEKDLLAIKVKENVSFQEAKRRLAFAQKGSFAEVARQGVGLPQFPALTQSTQGNCTEPQPPKQVRLAAKILAAKESGTPSKLPKDGAGSAPATPPTFSPRMTVDAPQRRAPSGSGTAAGAAPGRQRPGDPADPRQKPKGRVKPPGPVSGTHGTEGNAREVGEEMEVCPNASGSMSSPTPL